MAKKGKKKNKLQTLDLHGFRVAEVADAVDAFLMRANKMGWDRICILPGKGAGKVKAEVIRYLKLGGYPWQVETLDNGKRNEGSLIVFLD